MPTQLTNACSYLVAELEHRRCVFIELHLHERCLHANQLDPQHTKLATVKGNDWRTRRSGICRLHWCDTLTSLCATASRVEPAEEQAPG